MKSNGLSSTARNVIRKLNRHSTLISAQERVLAAKEKQKALLLQAKKAIADKQKFDESRKVESP
jgi:hypothetical protein